MKQGNAASAIRVEELRHLIPEISEKRRVAAERIVRLTAMIASESKREHAIEEALAACKSNLNRLEVLLRGAQEEHQRHTALLETLLKEWYQLAGS